LNSILRISDAASLALHTMCVLASKKEAQTSTQEIADLLSASAAHLSKVLQRLTKAGFVRASRGPGGGFLLTKRPDQISLLQVYEAIDGPLRPAKCLLNKQACNGECILGELQHSVGNRLRGYLAEKTLADLAASFSKKGV